MSSFFVELWESIFTPGPTPTILKAANASFAALQLVLLLMLFATHSIHCVILSVLCAGLWWSINWFAAELNAAQAREREEQARLKEKEKDKTRERGKEKSARASDGDDADADAEATETEVDTEVDTSSPLLASTTTTTATEKPSVGAVPESESESESEESEPEAESVPAPNAPVGVGLQPIEPRGEVKHRPGPGTQSSVSTEDEWEKVSEAENEKDK
ncbi:ER protein Pkr1-domain-containing protein [Mariannaea sp. PMI_226]|nr:ER protein Pkr1-domain-containing protein [Mariannaea sp. PMI_226]